MNNNFRLILFGIVIYVVIKLIFAERKQVIERYTNGKFSYTHCPKYSLSNVTKEVLDKHGILVSDAVKDRYSRNIYIPCGYTAVESELKNLTPHKDELIFGITGCDNIVSKDNIWKLLVDKYGREKAGELMPKTYLTESNTDLQQFQNEYKRDTIYILKKNLQRQTGLKLCKDMQEILHLCATDKKYAVIQEMLKNPFLVNGRKINLRVYILIICKDGKMTGYRYNDGFIYYTPEKYHRFSLKTDENITSGYVPRRVYQENPLTHKDLEKYLENKGYSPSYLYSKIDLMLKEVLEAVTGNLCTGKNLKNNLSFQLFGADVAPDGNLNCRLIEINKGPDMGAKDERDHALKFKLQEDILNLLGVMEYENGKNGEKERENGFIKFLEVTK